MSQIAQHKVAIITGAAGSFGAELTLACSLAGWEIVMLDKDRRGLEKLYDQVMQAEGVEPSIHVVDLATVNPQQCLEIVAALESGPGRLDALVHCAASFDGLQPLDHINPQDWLHQIQVNLSAPWLLSVSCLPLLRRSPDASLYFLSEDLGKVKGAYWGAYGVSKHGLHVLAGQFAAELRNTMIQVLSLNPGPLRSPLRARVYHSENPLEHEDPKISASKVLQLMERNVPPGALEVPFLQYGR